MGLGLGVRLGLGLGVGLGLGHQHVRVWCVCACLHEAKHAGALEVVEEAVGVDEEACRAAREERAPPPSVVLDGELEVGEG